MKMKLGSLAEGSQFRSCCCILPALVFLTFLPVAHGGVTITVVESGGGVTMRASGSVNLDGLTMQGNVFNTDPKVDPSDADFSLGASAGGGSTDVGDTYRANDGESITHPASLGIAGPTLATTGTGLLFGFTRGSTGPTGGAPDLIQVPDEYTSGSPINATATFNGATIASLGLSPGQYTWSWSSAGNADSITMIVSQPVVDNSAEKRKLSKKIGKLSKKAKAAKRKKKFSKARRLKKQVKKLKKQLRKL